MHITWHIFGRDWVNSHFHLTMHFPTRHMASLCRAISCVFRAGRLGANTDHNSILFDVDKEVCPRHPEGSGQYHSLSCFPFKEFAIFRCIPSDSASNLLCLILLCCLHPEFFYSEKKGGDKCQAVWAPNNGGASRRGGSCVASRNFFEPEPKLGAIAANAADMTRSTMCFK